MNIFRDYSNLQGKTFLDFTTDRNIINQIIFGIDDDFFRKNVSISGRFFTYLELAELTNDKELEKAAEQQFPNMFDE
jgi:hypothetical protein